MENRVILVSGASRGLGNQVATQLCERGHTVYFGARNPSQLEEIVSRLNGAGKKAIAVELDVTQLETAKRVAEQIKSEHNRLDTLVNNAGVIVQPAANFFELSSEEALDTFNTNTLGPVRLTQACLPILENSDEPIIVNVSSGMGSLTEMGSGHTAYRFSKTCLNALTKQLHFELHERGFKINSVCPGWVRTDMGGPQASRQVKDGAQGIIWAATLPDDGPSGGFFRDAEPIAF